ncbi:hypothetical protein M0811_03545 [Anaeramoeba ignava]|uniref:DUF4185 domain-containing protein n=1 Tax=Anaeramoeba ignava TaxID=1746090 RepID=A0A9Q0L4V1_ANAIG|nr:hypothetical protein M0811_03545 [Anaeramoeba ignava]
MNKKKKKKIKKIKKKKNKKKKKSFSKQLLLYIALLIHLSPIIYGISNKYSREITIKLVFESFSGWAYLTNILCLLLIFLNETIFKTKKKLKEKIQLSRFLDHLILTTRNIQISICVGYWVVVIPLTAKFTDSPFSIINKHIKKTWFMILNDFVLHVLPLSILFLPFKKCYLSMKKWITLIPFLFFFFVSYIVFSAAYFLTCRNPPYFIEYSVGVGWGLLILLLYFLGTILAHSIGYWIFRKRKAKKDPFDLFQDEKKLLIRDDQNKPKTKIVNYKAFAIICMILIILILISGIGVGLSLKDRETLSNYKITYEEVTPESNQFWSELTQAREKASITSQDGGTDVVIALDNSSAMWFYCDTILKNGFLSNTGMIITNSNNSYQINYYLSNTDHASEIFLRNSTEKGSELAIWPHGGILVNDTTYVYVDFVSRNDGQLWPKQKHVYGMYSAPAGSFNFTRILEASFSYPILPDFLFFNPQDNYYYAYFIQRPTIAMSGVYLARIHADKLTDPSQPYEFYYGDSKFSRDPKMSTQLSPPIAVGVFGQTSACWNNYLNRYVLFQVGVPGKFHSIYIRTAKNLWGPFSSPYLVYSQKSSSYLYYCPYVHPELFEEDGRVMYVTYSLSGDVNNRMVKIILEKK